MPHSGQSQADLNVEHHVMDSKKDFHHPYTPYAIQESFMETVYQVLEEGNVGILESPTGTGKSLSLICASLTWLRDHKGKAFQQGLDWGEDVSNEPAWIVDQMRARKRRELLRDREEMESRLAEIRAKEKAQHERYLSGASTQKRRKVDAKKDTFNDEEDQFVLEDYDSDGEQLNTSTSGLSSATLALMEKLGMVGGPPKEEEAEVQEEIKIFFCSRTHSQLTQFIGELGRTRFPSAIPPEDPKSEPEPEDIKHLTLGSRKNLCINPAVKKLNSVSSINERCQELQQSSTAKEHKCSFLPNQDNQSLVNNFRDHALATIRDIEDMGALGKEIGICPYYASRAAIKPAEIVTLPYPLLLQKSAREALGLSLKGHVVIIDEAHNLMDAIAGIHSVEISLLQLKKARSQLGGYLQKFRNKLKGKNRVYIAQVVRLIDSLSRYLEAKAHETHPDGTVNEKDLLAGKGVDQINLFKLVKYLQDSKLARKVESYSLHIISTNPEPQPTAARPETASPVLHHVSSLLTALTHPSSEGQLFYNKTSESISLKFQLLDPSPSFQEIVTEARAVVLAGGTMSPMSDFTSHLFPYLPPTKITTLSCGHVIPSANLLAWNLAKGPSGTDFEFTYNRRNDTAMIDDLGRALLNICTIVPDGVVVFFPSYAYLANTITRWSISIPPSQESILSRLRTKKAMFQESKEVTTEAVLAEYAQAIDTGRGGLLLSVVGGKMSEGINFSDRLGRCVIIIGLPFPNAGSAEWKAKLSYIESSYLKSSSSRSPSNTNRTDREKEARASARDFYENACMRAVNQSVGRAIRHRNDYAAIVLVDKRYGRRNILEKLPKWIKENEGLIEGSERGFGTLMSSLGAFFRGKRGS
ncbi:hypothetical protein BP5796_07185 [Coleophoma crateriformis]|uniref:ATP-dependent DNA helicase CHL1 n=1 Tax=Coleophoma crateriformis TaxID=565419 RepID=A0A3D8RI73_9HELO|nr:hypothetical protein BP5796_07185 [Coleophoma crateriformis]